MAARQVKATGKDSDGDITSLCNSGETWSPRSKAGAIADIDGGVHTYHVGSGASKTEIEVVNDPVKGKYLRTVADGSTGNNLDELPDC
jgi:hypothetical protein